MKTILSFVSLLVLSLAAFAQTNEYNPKNAYLIKSFTGDKINNLEVKTSGGFIEVIGGSKSIEVEVYARRNNSYLSERADIGSWNIDIDTKGSMLFAIAQNNKMNSRDNISISFVIRVPDDVNTELKTSGGHIALRNIQGSHELHTSGGHIEMEGVRGIVDGKTSGGHLTITDSQGKISLRTSGGHIDIKNTEGDVNVRTSGGHIKLANVSGEFDASTSGGNIDASFVTITNRINLETSGGNITAELPQSDYDLDLDGSFVNAKVNNFEGFMERDRIRGKVGKGGVKVHMETSGGIVNVRFLDSKNM